VVDIDEKLKNEYLGLFKKYNDNNNQYNVEVSNPTNNSFIIKLTKDGTTIPFTFNVNRNPNNNNKIEKIDMKVDDIIKNPYERNYMDGKNTYWIKYKNSQWYHNVVPQKSS
jgi:hypothetical protein